MSSQGNIVMKWEPAAVLLAVKYSKRINLSEMVEHLSEVISLAPAIRPGFTLLTDLSDLEYIEKPCIPVLAHIMDQYRKYGIRQVIRVIPHPEQDIGFNILSIFHYGSKIPVIICSRLEEAKGML